MELESQRSTAREGWDENGFALDRRAAYLPAKNREMAIWNSRVLLWFRQGSPRISRRTAQERTDELGDLETIDDNVDRATELIRG